jgi:peptidoglycan DL-endopeptidase CwlO
VSPRKTAEFVVALVIAIALIHAHIIGSARAGAARAQAPEAAAPARFISGRAAPVIRFARDQLGKPYLYGGTGPDSWDCSGLVQAAWAAGGVAIPRTSEEQWAALPHISGRHLRPGDLIFETGAPVDAPPGHVYLYIGHGLGLEAYAAGYPVRIIHVRWSDATGFARVP